MFCVKHSDWLGYVQSRTSQLDLATLTTPCEHIQDFQLPAGGQDKDIKDKIKRMKSPKSPAALQFAGDSRWWNGDISTTLSNYEALGCQGGGPKPAGLKTSRSVWRFTHKAARWVWTASNSTTRSSFSAFLHWWGFLPLSHHIKLMSCCFLFFPLTPLFASLPPLMLPAINYSHDARRAGV